MTCQICNNQTATHEGSGKRTCFSCAVNYLESYRVIDSETAKREIANNAHDLERNGQGRLML